LVQIQKAVQAVCFLRGGIALFFVLIMPPYVLFSQLPFLPYPMAVTFLPSGMTCFLGFI
jgi:hypothetical protein